MVRIALVQTFLKSLLSEVFESQSILDELWAEWRRAIDSQVVDETKRPGLEARLVSSGFFSEITRAINARDHHRLNSIVVQYATDRETLNDVKTAQALMTAFRSKVHSKFFIDTPRVKQASIRLRKGDSARPTKRASETDKISQLIAGMENASERAYTYVGAFEAKARVDKQIDAIRDVLFAGKNSTAEKYLEDLMNFQLGQGDREHAAMSLCALTAIALDANQFDVADRLSQYALKLAFNDKVVYTSRAEVLKQRGHFDAALMAYEEAIERFGQDRWALNGHADVLKDKGLFNESISQYTKIQKLFPDDSVAFNGEIGVLRARGELRRALGLAAKCAKRFEYDSVTRGTLAACLASVGKYQESLRQYRQAIDLDLTNSRTHVSYMYVLRDSGNLESALRHADFVLAKLPKMHTVLNIKATLLRSAGRLGEAEAIYLNLIDLYPTYMPAKFGLAATHVLQKKIEEAQRILPEDNMESELDWYGFRLKALSYASTGDYRRAEPRLSFALQRCPWLKERVKVETALGFVELHRGEVVRSISLLNKNLDQLDEREQQVRQTFLAHAHAMRGAASVATVLLGSHFTSKDPSLRLVRDAIVNEYKLSTTLTSEHGNDYGQLKTQELSLAMAA